MVQVPPLAIGNRSQSRLNLEYRGMHDMLQTVRTVRLICCFTVLNTRPSENRSLNSMVRNKSGKFLILFDALRRPTIHKFQIQFMYFKPCHNNDLSYGYSTPEKEMDLFSTATNFKTILTTFL